MYVAARTVGRSFFQGRVGRRLLNEKAMARIERLYKRHGTWGIFLSRFIPGARAVIPPFAGVAGLSGIRALPPMIVASGIWYGILTYLAANVVPQLDDVVIIVGRMNLIGLVGLSLIVVIVGSIVLMRIRRGRAKEAQGRRS